MAYYSLNYVICLYFSFNGDLMKKLIVAALVMVSVGAHASNTITAGYAQTSNDGETLKGFNGKYTYTPDGETLGYIGSLTITGLNEDKHIDGVKTNVKAGYGSLMGGLSYSVGDIKPYVLAGISRGVLKTDPDGFDDHEETKTGFAYGAGIQYNVFNGFTVDASYEGSKLFSSQTNTFTVGAGYEF
jgi:opacity protein-like surface antigen